MKLILYYMLIFTISSHIGFRVRLKTQVILILYTIFVSTNKIIPVLMYKFASFTQFILSQGTVPPTGFGLGSIGQGAYHYENCATKYLGEKLFGNIDYIKKVYMRNWNNVSKPNVFNNKTRKSITSLSHKDVCPNMKLFATGERILVGYFDEKLYELVQFSRDLSSSDCKKFFNNSVNELPNYCEGKRGCRVISRRCNIRTFFLGLKHNIQIIIPYICCTW
ncbi:hypothetical protein MKW92_000993 [Papaver armeniacum]|nr:hypothetical protein MKW92_000993 [Papaver armeniacum]